jgi:hypothetical protein
MKHADTYRMGYAVLLATALVAAACHSHSHHHKHPPVYLESEINDDELCADYFGMVQPGTHLFVEGHITDIPFDPFDPNNGHDPFDGFAFTADRPIHVEFALWADDPYADLDICVWDPQIGAEVACYMTADHPEVGAIDVLAGGLEFHLVVESYSGISSYSLEVSVYTLYADSAAPAGRTIVGSPATRLEAAVESSDAPREDSRRSTCAGKLAGYARAAREEDAPRLLESFRVLELDHETGEITRMKLGLFDDGTWMGMRGDRAQ